MNVARTISRGVNRGSLPFYPPGFVIAGRYKVIRSLGQGGMASVYLAEDQVLGKTEVAIKILQSRSKEHAPLIERFIREVQLTHKINHENVVRTFDFGQDGDTIFYSMEYLPGVPLDSFITKQGCDLDIVMRFAAQLVKGIGAVHGVGVIHRDIKPANIIVSDSGLLKITDFGVAKVSTAPKTMMSSDVMGTVAYIAPEVLRGENATRAVDYYALGVVLYELLAGESPFHDENPARVILRKLEEEPIPIEQLRPDTPQWLADVIADLLSLDIETRSRAMLALEVRVDAQSIAQRKLAKNHGRDLKRERLSVASTGKIRIGFFSVQALLVMLCALLVIPVSLTDTFAKIEDDGLDTLFRWRGARSPHPDVVVVAIDEQSYSNLGVPLTSPWPRALHARVANALADAGARRVVFDVIFAGADTQDEDDRALAESLTRVPTVLGAALGFSQRATVNGAFLLEELIQPDPLFEHESIGIGVVGMPQRHGRVRGFFESRSEVFPNLSSLAEMAVMVDRPNLERPSSDDLVNFYGPSKTIPTISYETVLESEPKMLRRIFQGKIVFIGLGLRSSTGPSQRDAFMTPFDAATYGTELHATAASNLLKNDWIRRPGMFIHSLVNCLLAAAVVYGVMVAAGASGILGLVGLLAVALLGQFAAFVAGWYVPIVSGCLWGVFTGVLARVLLVPTGTCYARGWR